MTIPVSSVVSVSIDVGAVFPSRAGFGTLNIVTKESGVIGIAERIRFYSDLDGVTADWGSTTEVVAAATAYFAQQPKPTSLAVSVRFETAQSAELRGGGSSETTVATWEAITDGSFTISIDGVEEDITAIDFTGDTTLDLVAATIEAKIQAVAAGGYTLATCTHDGTRFFITSGTTGSTSTISFLTTTSPASGTDIVSMLDMASGNATKSDGVDAEDITTSLDSIQKKSSDWYGLAFTKEVRDLVVINSEDAVEAAADWCEARVKVFVNTANSIDVLDPVTTTDIASVLEAKSLRRTMTTYSSHFDQYPSCSIIGRAFTVNFSQPDATITLKFKSMPTITYEDLTTNEKTVLDAKSANALIDVGGNYMFSESYMANGSFLDELHGLDWLTDAIQTNIFGYLLTRTTKVPYTDKGVAALEQQLINALDEGVRNGLIAPGETIDGEFLPLGYKTVTTAVADVDQSAKEGRNYAGLSFTLIGAGAIHSGQVNGTFIR